PVHATPTTTTYTFPYTTLFRSNKKGLDNASIGYGNEKALNQLLAHHGIVFKPAERLVWVSSNPYQLGEFVAYNLNTVFSEAQNKDRKSTRLNSSHVKISYAVFC